MKKRIKLIIFWILIMLAFIAINIPLNMNTNVSKLEKNINPNAGGRGSGFTVGSPEYGSNMTTMYDYMPDGYTYCAGYNWSLVRREGYGESDPIVDGGVTNGYQETEYTHIRTVEMAQSIAFGLYHHYSGEEIQNLVWASDQWIGHTGSSCLEGEHPDLKYSSNTKDKYGRAYRFSEFVYNALNQGSETLGLKGSPTSDTDSRLRIMVDQSNQTYTVGPYNIWFDNYNNGLTNGDGKTRDLVWDEITHTTNADIGKFASGVLKAIVTYQDGSTEIVSSNKLQILDTSGGEIPENFPKFGTKKEDEFYVRYQASANNEKIVDKITPVIEINYAKKFSGGGSGSAGGSSGEGSSGSGGIINAYVYKSKSIRFKMLEDKIGLLRYEMFGFGCGRVYLGRYPWCYAWPGFTGDSLGKRVIQLCEKDGTSEGRTFSLIRDSTTVIPLTTYGLDPMLISDLEFNLKDVLGSLGWPATDIYFENWEIEIGHIVTNTTSEGESHEVQGWYPDLDSIDLTFSSTGGEEIPGKWNVYDKEEGRNDSTGYDTREEAEDHIRNLDGGFNKYEATQEPSTYTNYILKATVETDYTVGDFTGKEFTYEVSYDSFQSNSRSCWQTLLDRVNEYFILHVYLGFEIKNFSVLETTDKIQPAVVLDEPTLRGTGPTTWGTPIPGSYTSNGSGESVTFGCKEFNMYLGGNVWESLPSIKVGDFGDNQNDGSLPLGGIQVELWDAYTNSLMATTTTDSSGEYGFQKLNPLHKYYVVFEYDGMRFENAQYTNNLQSGSGGYSLAQENRSDRENLNTKFSEIQTSPQNYDGWKKAYGLYSKIEDSNQNYIQYDNYAKNDGANLGAFRYSDALDIFTDIATKNSSSNPYGLYGNQDTKRDFDLTSSATMNSTYHIMRFHDNEGYNTLEGIFKDRLRQIGAPNQRISEEEINNIWTYMVDTRIRATNISQPDKSYPDVLYPEESEFTLENVDSPQNNSVIGYPYLYNASKDQSRELDFGVHLRTNADLWLSKDLYKTTLLVNGKQEEYIYDKKKSITDASGNWQINLNTGTYGFNGPTFEDRANNSDYNSGETYTRELRKSEYLYDGSDTTGKIYDDIKNLQVFVTYKIAIKNQSQDIWTSVDEIVDYYDINQYQYFDEREGHEGQVIDSKIVKENTFVGDANGNKKYDITVSTDSRYVSKYNSMQGYYNSSNNINGLYDYSSLYITGIRATTNQNMGNVRLQPGELTYVYITFKVKTDNQTGKVKIDQNVDELLNGNVIETNGKKNIAEINGYSTFYSNGDRAGVIDLDSNPGSLKAKDIDSNGNIISSSNSWQNRLEDDTDKASNLKLIIDIKTPDPGTDPDPDPNEKDTRSISGYVFEDARTEISNQAVIGNGVYNPEDEDVQGNKDKKINGVTVQLVELVQEVNAEGFPTGNYTGEHIWTSVVYQRDGANWTDVNANTEDPRYYSGTDKSKVIISGPGIFEVNPTDLTLNQGEYRFDSLPPGIFFVRFIYGDTTQTVLTNGTDESDEVQNIFNNVPEEQKEEFQEVVQNEVEKEHNKILGTSGLNSISYTGQDYKSTIYQKGVNQDPSVNNFNGIIGYVSTETQNYNRDNANDKNAMYNYDIDESTINAISDAKDVYSYREDEMMKYSMGSTDNSAEEGLQTLKNHRAEVLASGTKLTTRAKDDITSKINVLIDKYTEENNKNNYVQATKDQLEAIEELINNTKMVAQTGVINMQVEYNRDSTKVYNKDGNDNVSYVQDLGYHIQDLNLGLTERPEAQLELSKELTNIQIRLANNRILFDTNQSVSNLVYGKHNKYTDEDFYYKVEKDGVLAYRLRQYIAIKQKERQEELVYASMDEELMSGATVRLTYKIRVDNIGEVDYLDKDFYYLGKTSNPGWENISRTNARRVIDYISNESNYEANYQNDVDNWSLITTNIILGGETNNEDNDLVNKLYEDNLNTYNVLVTTNKLSEDLIPRVVDTTEDLRYSKEEIDLVLSTLLANTVKDKNLVYTNLVEILETTNTNGRRMQLSKVGNQPMPYQSEELSIDESSVWVHPQELDADSGQKVQITVPTGENRNYNRMIVITISSLAILGISIFIIKKKVLKK